MSGDITQQHASTLGDYLGIVRRRKWLVVQAIVLVPLAAIVFSLHQTKLYEASAQVFLSRQDLASTLTGAQDPTLSEQQPEITQTQADIARVPAIATQVLAQVKGSGLSVQGFLASSSVSSPTNADLLTFGVTNSSTSLAERLVDAYASQYTIYRHQLDTAAIARALDNVNARLEQLDHAGESHSALYANLADRQETLATMEALETSNASVVKTADGATQVQPRTTRNGILGLLLGVVLGIGLAFVREALDTRVRSAQEVAERLQLPLLARIVEPPRALRESDRLVMLAEPSGVHAEGFRMLRTNLEFAMLDREVRSIMVTSAIQREGKSTTVANLALALARAGQRVILVDLDLRRPYLDKFFDLERCFGVTQVALGRATLAEALVRIPILPIQHRTDGGARSPNGSAATVRGKLAILGTGPLPPDPGEFVASGALSEVLRELRGLADLVLVDAPPLLQVGDAMTLSAKVDAALLVTRLQVLRRPMVNELNRLIAAMPAHRLGFVVTGTESDGPFGYGGDYSYGMYGYEPLEAEVARQPS